MVFFPIPPQHESNPSIWQSIPIYMHYPEEPLTSCPTIMFMIFAYSTSVPSLSVNLGRIFCVRHFLNTSEHSSSISLNFCNIETIYRMHILHLIIDIHYTLYQIIPYVLALSDSGKNIGGTKTSTDST